MSFFDIFKKRKNEIDEYIAINDFLDYTKLYLKKAWPIISDELLEIMKKYGNFDLVINEETYYDIFLALVFLESRVPYNIFNEEQGERLWIFLNNHLAYLNLIKEKDLLTNFYNQWDYSLKNNINPLNCICAILLKKWGYDIKNNDIKYNSMIFEAIFIKFLTNVICQLKWWKNFSENNKLKKSRFPIEFDEFSKIMTELE